MGAVGVGPGRLAAYFILGTLVLGSVAANFVLYAQKGHYVLARPVGRSTLYESAELGELRSYPEEDLGAPLQPLRRRLSRELVLDAIESTQGKIEALGVYLLQCVRPHEGAPSPRPSEMSDIEVVDQLLAGQIGVWPDAIARLYVTMANAVGIPSRLVRLHNPIEGISHWFAESYVEEQNRWTVVDPRYRKLHLFAIDGRAVNAAELWSAVARDEISDLKVALFEGNTVVHRPLIDHAASDRFYFRPGATLEFLTADDLDPSVFRKVATYLFAPRDVYALEWQPFIRWGWVKLALLTVTGLLSAAFVLMLLRDLTREGRTSQLHN
jgi:hypothetical protein